MGNNYSHPPEDIQWNIVGRSGDIQNIVRLLPKVRQLNIAGLKKIGKSRVMFEVAKKTKLSKLEKYDTVFVNFDNVDEKELSAVREMFRHASKELFGIVTETNDSQRVLPEDRQEAIALLQKEVESLVQRASSKGERKIICFLDNLDKVMTSDLKDILLMFVKKSIQSIKGIKFVLAHAIKSKSTQKSFKEYELQQMCTKAVMDLLFEITENRDGKYTESTDEGEHFYRFDDEMRVFNPANEPYIKCIAELCEGLPIAAEVSGTLLTEDDGLITPPDLVEILIVGRLSSLSPDNCPPDERLDQYKNYIDEIKKNYEQFKQPWNNLNANIQGSEFGMAEARAAFGDNKATDAKVKMEFLKKALNYSLITGKNISSEQQWHLHGVFQECNAILKAVDNISDDEKSKEMVFKFMENNLKTVGIAPNEEIMNNRRKLEEAIRDFGNTSLKEKKDSEVEEETQKAEVSGICENSNKLSDKNKEENKTDDKRSVRYTLVTNENDEQLKLQFQNMNFDENIPQETFDQNTFTKQSSANPLNNVTTQSSQESMSSNQKPFQSLVGNDILTSKYSVNDFEFLQSRGASSDTNTTTYTSTNLATQHAPCESLDPRSPIPFANQQASHLTIPFTNRQQYSSSDETPPFPVMQEGLSHDLTPSTRQVHDNPPPYNEHRSYYVNDPRGCPPPYSYTQQTVSTRIDEYDSSRNLTPRGSSNVVSSIVPDSKISVNHNNTCYSSPENPSTNHRVQTGLTHKVERLIYDTQHSPNTRRKEIAPYTADSYSPPVDRHNIGASNQATRFGNSHPSQNLYQQCANNIQSQFPSPQHNSSTQQFQIMQPQHVPQHFQMTANQQYSNGQPSLITEHQRIPNAYQRLPGSSSQSPICLTNQGQISPGQLLDLSQSDTSQMAVGQTTYHLTKYIHQSNKRSYSPTDQAFPMTPNQPTSQIQHSQISPLNNHQSSFPEASSHQPQYWQEHQNDLQITVLPYQGLSNYTSQTSGTRFADFSVTGPPALTYNPPSNSTSVQNPNPPYALNVHQAINPVQAMSSLRTSMDNKNDLMAYNPPSPVVNNPGSPVCQAQMSGFPSWNSG